MVAAVILTMGENGCMPDVSSRLADRYGGPLVSASTARILVTLGAVAFLAVVVVVGMRLATPAVRADVISYEHLADDQIGVGFVVTMAPGTEASCRIQALNKGRAQVGFVEVAVPAQTARQSTHHVEIATQGEAVSAEIVRCDAR